MQLRVFAIPSVASNPSGIVANRKEGVLAALEMTRRGFGHAAHKNIDLMR